MSPIATVAAILLVIIGLCQALTYTEEDFQLICTCEYIRDNNLTCSSANQAICAKVLAVSTVAQFIAGYEQDRLFKKRCPLWFWPIWGGIVCDLQELMWSLWSDKREKEFTQTIFFTALVAFPLMGICSLLVDVYTRR
jgi:hypothetical protein